MQNLRTYGKAPYTVAVIHGGPGAPGQMAPVARELSGNWGVLEPLQTAASFEGQVQELKTVLENHADIPVTLIGFSWGAWLSYILAAGYPELVKKLILIGSGSFEEKYADKINDIRFSRLCEDERKEAYSLINIFTDPSEVDKNTAFARLGKLFTKADACNPVTLETEEIDVQYNIFQSVWSEAAELRRRGTLLKLGKQIQCPVVAVHGDYDAHLPEGVQKCLSNILEDFKFILLKNCGHMPWIETAAKDEFYKILKEESGKV
ncbi:alpha/beta fold hydrolase [candidate division KSB1 bacterium]